jgi:hypothetical protein
VTVLTSCYSAAASNCLSSVPSVEKIELSRVLMKRCPRFSCLIFRAIAISDTIEVEPGFAALL